MLKLIPTLLCLGIILLACERKSEFASEVDKVRAIQENLAIKPQDSTLIYLKTAQQMLEGMKVAPDSLLAENNFLIGSYFNGNGRIDSAAVYFYRAIDQVNDSLHDNRQMQYYKSAWNAHASLGLFGDCLKISDKLKAILREDINYSSYTWAYYWEKSAYLMMGDYDKAEKVLNLQLEFTEQKDTANIPYVINALADLKHTYLGDKQGAMKMLENLLDAEERLSPRFKEQTHTNYGVYQYFVPNYDKALFHYLKALKAGKSDSLNSDYLNTIANGYSNISEVYLDLKKYDIARTYLDSTNQLGIENMSRDKQKALLNYELRYAIETNQGGKIIAKLMGEIYTHQDEIYTQRSKIELQELTKANEKEKLLLAEKRQADLVQFRFRTGAMIGLILTVMLGIIGLLFYQRRKLKFEQRSLENQQRLLRSQMNPHFTFNTLYAIQTEMKKDQKSASDYLLKFSRLLRLILENSTQNYVQLEKELDAIRKYIDLQSIRQTSKFDYHIELENLEEDDLVFIPPMLLQPFVENSIEHGFSNLNYHGKLDITLSLQEKFIHCTIEDNGNGISDQESNYKKSSSVGLISDFIEKATKSKLQIIDKSSLDKDQSGVSIKFLIPYRLTEND